MAPPRKPVADEHLADLYRAGLTLEDIGRRVGMHRQAVYKRLLKAGVPMRMRGRRAVELGEIMRRIARGERVPDIATDLRVTDHAIYIRMRRHGHPVGARPDPRRQSSQNLSRAKRSGDSSV